MYFLVYDESATPLGKGQMVWKQALHNCNSDETDETWTLEVSNRETILSADQIMTILVSRETFLKIMEFIECKEWPALIYFTLKCK